MRVDVLSPHFQPVTSMTIISVIRSHTPQIFRLEFIVCHVAQDGLCGDIQLMILYSVTIKLRNSVRSTQIKSQPWIYAIFQSPVPAKSAQCMSNFTKDWGCVAC